MITFIIILAFTTIWYLLGKSLSEYLWSKAQFNYHSYFLAGSNFIVGALLFLASWLILSHLTGEAKFSLGLLTFLSIIYCVYTDRLNLKLSILNRRGLWLLLAISLFSLLFILKALLPMPQYFVTNPQLTSPFFGFGAVGHSFRAGNLTQYIVDENQFPNINQHSGQAIIASIPLFLGQTSPQLSLTLWLALFIFIFSLTVYGLARTFIKNRLIAIIPVATVFLGNTVLSPFYSSVTDTDSALLMSSNTESIFGIFSFTVVSLLIYENKSKNIVTLALGTILFFCGVLWNVTSGQMIILLSALLALGSLVETIRKNNPAFYIKFLLALTIGAALGAFTLGGMLFAREVNTSLPGLMSVKNNDYAPIELRFPRTGEGNPNTLHNLKLIKSELSRETKAISKSTEISETDKELKATIKSDPILLMIAKLTRSVQLVFFPLLAIIGSYFLYRRKILFSDNHSYRTLWGAITILFLIGWVISSSLTIYGYYWELSKFFFMGIFSSMFLLGLVMAKLIENGKLKTKIIVGLLFVFVIFGPSLEFFGVKLFGNFYLTPQEWTFVADKLPTEEFRPLTLAERLTFLFNSRGYYGTDL